jgi:Carboxypeptidase regulatory-like domain
MARFRPAALILVAASHGGLLGFPGAPGAPVEAGAQQVSAARIVPTVIPPPPASLLTPLKQATRATTTAAAGAVTGSQAGAATPAAGAASNAKAGSPPAATGNGLAGRVLGSSAPLSAAGVYAYQLADLALYKVMTDPQGNFLFRDLPAGLYKIIAHKPGFLPAVILVTRTTAKTYQFLELQLAQRAAAGSPRSPTADGAGSAGAGDRGHGGRQGGAASPNAAGDEDFWALRASIPADVLRDIEMAEGPAERTAVAKGSPGGAALEPAQGGMVTKASLPGGGPAGGRFRTEVQAMTGVADVAQVGVGKVASGRLGIQGQLGQVQVGLSGRFWHMSDGLLTGGGASRITGASGDGKTDAVSLDVSAGPSSRITVTSLNNHLLPRGLTGQRDAPPAVGLEHYQVSWSQALGENSHSELAAQYTSESNYHRLSAIDPAEIPGASRTWNVGGSYTTGIGDSSTLQAGFRYSQSLLDLTPLAAPQGGLTAVSSGNLALASAPSLAAPTLAAPAYLATALAPDHQTIDLFSRGGTRLRPAFLVEYGLFTTLLDGSVSLAPQGGLVLEMDGGWQARGSATRRVYQQSPLNPVFLPALFKESDLCEERGRSCYELSFSHHAGEDDAMSITAMERIVGQTLRLYFSDMVFDRLESIYLVPGDRVPELRVVVSHRLSPKVKASFESSFATGGGGVFIGADGRPYKNQVQYIVSSLDTRFLPTATGVFLAFHHLSQGQTLGTPSLAAGASHAGGAAPVSTMELNRLQLMLSQDLSVLWNLASQWALQVDMELSRGSAPYLASTDTQLHRRILGGIAVKF